ncbi:MAG: pyridoxal phosphate-dependent aminotransferase [Bilifractor sp.]
MYKNVHGGDVYRHLGVIDFSSNMNPLGTPERVVRAAQNSMTEICHYPDVRQSELIRALSGYEKVPEPYLFCGNGAAEVIFAYAWALRPGRALVPAPTFAEYAQALQSTGCTVMQYPIRESDGFCLTDDFIGAITDDLDVVFLCNPNNPTGLLVDPSLMQKIMTACRMHDVRLFVDECFQDFINDPEVHTLKGYLHDNPDIFILKAFTKRYAMAGLRLGYGMTSDAALLDRMHASVQPWNVSIPAQKAGVAALQEEDYVSRARKIIQTERAWMKKSLQALGLQVFDSKANYIFFKGPQNLPEKVLPFGVMIRDCSNYYGLGNGYYRTAVRLHTENEKLIEALQRAMQKD